MKSPFDEIDKAFAPLEETLTLTKDRPPHRKATFSGVVLQGIQESQTAGIQTAQIIGDVWTVRLPSDSIIIGDVSTGDTIQRACGGEALTVQQVYIDSTGDFWILCTAEERAPLG